MPNENTHHQVNQVNMELYQRNLWFLNHSHFMEYPFCLLITPGIKITWEALKLYQMSKNNKLPCFKNQLLASNMIIPTFIVLKPMLSQYLGEKKKKKTKRCSLGWQVIWIYLPFKKGSIIHIKIMNKIAFEMINFYHKSSKFFIYEFHSFQKPYNKICL